MDSEARNTIMSVGGHLVTSERQILVRQASAGGRWEVPETSAYDDEAHLKALLLADPGRVPAVSSEAHAVTELSTGGGPIDVCIVDADGSLTVIECKLASNSERRRMVIGQVIDYASGIWNGGDASFLKAWRHRGGIDLEDVLASDALVQLKRNIAEGRINLCLAVDAIDSDLRRLVEYLNLVTLDHVIVTALQLAYARHGDLEILIPSTYGGEIAAAKTRAIDSGRALWTYEAFLESLGADTDREFFTQFLQRLETLPERRGDHDLVWYGRRPGGFVFVHPYGLRYAPFQFRINKAGQLMAYGNWKNYPAVAGHNGFASLASVMGQDHLSSAKNVSVRQLDLERLWEESLRSAIAVNSTPTAGDAGPFGPSPTGSASTTATTFDG